MVSPSAASAATTSDTDARRSVAITGARGGADNVGRGNLRLPRIRCNGATSGHIGERQGLIGQEARDHQGKRGVLAPEIGMVSHSRRPPRMRSMISPGSPGPG